MKYCEKCGNELMDEAVIYPNCGCPVQNLTTNISENIIEKENASKSSVVLGIIEIVGGLLHAIVGHICSIIAIVMGINDCIKHKKTTELILGIIGEVVSILSSIIGASVAANWFG